MEVKNLTDNVLSITLSSCEPQISKELKEINEIVSKKDDCDVVVDLTYVEIINSSNISNLLILRGFLEEHGRKLFLFNVQTITKCIFVIAGLTEVFNFIDDKADALKAVQTTA